MFQNMCTESTPVAYMSHEGYVYPSINDNVINIAEKDELS